MTNRTVLATIASIAAVVLLAGCSSDDGSDTAAETPTTTTTAEFVPEETATEETVAAQCDPAPDQYVAVINGSFTDSGLSLGPAYVVVGDDDVQYIGAHIMRGDERESSADVWVAQGPAVYALSGSAREYSMLPDGRDVLGVSAGDEYGSAVQDCTIQR